MNLQKIFLNGVLATSFALSSLTAYAAETSNLEAVTCWEVATLPEADAAYALVLLYGYNAGKDNQAIQTTSKMAKAIEAASETCNNNPDMLALKAFPNMGKSGFDTVSMAKAMADDAHVVLVGRLLKRLKGERYIFKDNTGEIEVDIDRDIYMKAFGKKRIAPTMKVRIVGEVDKGVRSIEIDVDSIELAK